MSVCGDNTSISMNRIDWTPEKISAFLDDNFDSSMYDSFLEKITNDEEALKNFIKSSSLLFDDDGNLHSVYYRTEAQ